MNAAEKSCFFFFWLFNQFDEDKEGNEENNCCDICTKQHSVTLIDWREELRTVTDAMYIIGSSLK